MDWEFWSAVIGAPFFLVCMLGVILNCVQWSKTQGAEKKRFGRHIAFWAALCIVVVGAFVAVQTAHHFL